MCYEFGPFRLETGKRVLWREGEIVPLKPKAFEILVALIEERGRRVTLDDLMRKVWPDVIVEENNITVNMSRLRRALGEVPPYYKYIITHPGAGYEFIADVRVLSRLEGADFLHPGVREADSDHPPTSGAIPVASKYYVVRRADGEFQSAVARGDSIVLIKGPRQVGKTSLLARGLERAREMRSTVVLTDFQELSRADFVTAEALYLTLGKKLAEALGLDRGPRATWDPDDSPNINFGRFVIQEVLGRTTGLIVWGMDEIDRVFECPFAGDLFGLFRSWYNRRSLDPAGPWRSLSLVLAYATEAHLFIVDHNQSPFNVGTRLTLQDFSIDEVAELNRRYGSPVSERELIQFYHLVAGHPFLSQVGLYRISCGTSVDELEAVMGDDDVGFGDHLRRIASFLSEAPDLREAMKAVLDGRSCLSAQVFYRLRSAGLIAGETMRKVRPRCPLYAAYLEQLLR